jgi:hypothetical protein
MIKKITRTTRIAKRKTDQDPIKNHEYGDKNANISKEYTLHFEQPLVHPIKKNINAKIPNTALKGVTI